MGGRGSAKDVTGFERARSTCSTCGGVGSLGDSKVGCCDFGDMGRGESMKPGHSQDAHYDL